MITFLAQYKIKGPFFLSDLLISAPNNQLHYKSIFRDQPFESEYFAYFENFWRGEG